MPHPSAGDRNAREILEAVAASTRGRPIIAYCLAKSSSFAMFTDLQLGEGDPCFGWVGYWSSADDPLKGVPPSLIVAAAFPDDAERLRHQIAATFASFDVHELLMPDAYVLLASRTPLDRTPAIVRVVDPQPFFDAWLRVALTGI